MDFTKSIRTVEREKRVCLMFLLEEILKLPLVSAIAMS